MCSATVCSCIIASRFYTRMRSNVTVLVPLFFSICVAMHGSLVAYRTVLRAHEKEVEHTYRLHVHTANVDYKQRLLGLKEK